MGTIKKYFSELKLNELPANATTFVNNEILNDADIDLLDDTDEDFIAVKELIERDYPSALSVTTPTPAPVEAASKPSELVLKMRLKAIAKLMDKEPNSVVLKMRVKAVNKLLGGEKMRDGGNVGQVSFKDKKDSGKGFGLRTYIVRNEKGKWKIFSSSDKWNDRDEDMDFASKEDAIHTAKVMAGHIKEKYNDGGNVKHVDLFEHYDQQTPELREITERYSEMDNDYENVENLLKEVEAVGYTFEYGLDAEPYGLRPIGVDISELEGFEE